MKAVVWYDGVAMNERESAAKDPREKSAGTGVPQDVDPESGASDDPRVDPTPDKRQSDTDSATRKT